MAKKGLTDLLNKKSLGESWIILKNKKAKINRGLKYHYIKKIKLNFKSKNFRNFR